MKKKKQKQSQIPNKTLIKGNQIPNKNLIKGAIRRLFARSPQKYECLNKAIHPTIKGPRGGKQYICSTCKKTFSANKVQVDHIDPVIPVNKTINDLDYNMIVARIFCNIKNLQVICTECHKIKTKEERKQRKQHKKK